MDPTPLRGAHRALLDAATTVADAADAIPPPPGEWTAEQILAHVALIDAATLAAASLVASGAHTTYDNRTAQDAWTLDRTITHAGGTEGLRERIRHHGDALCALAPALSDAELDTTVPSLLLSNGTVLVDQPLRLRDILTGLAEAELPGHTRQLLALLPATSAA